MAGDERAGGIVRPLTHDVLVVGGGIIGTSIAYYLSKRAIDVGVVEKGYLGSGCSGATAGLVGAGMRTPVNYALLAERSKELYAELSVNLGREIHYERCGMIWTFRTPATLKKGATVIQLNGAAGIDISHVDRAGVSDLEPHLSTDTILGAAFCPTDGRIDPFAALRGLAAQIRNQGGSLYFNTRVLRVEPGRRTVRLVTSGGVFEAPKLVIAAGIWSPLICQSMGIGLPLRPVRGQVLITQRMPRLFTRVISPAISQCWRGNIILGFSSEEVGYDNRNTFSALQSIAADNILKSPELRNARIIRSFSGLRPMPFDGYPLLDQLPGHRNIFVASTHSGIALSQAIGDYMAQWIAEDKKDRMLDDYSLRRPSLAETPRPYRAAGEEGYSIGRKGRS